jgi:Flp pilus assembly protein TadG
MTTRATSLFGRARMRRWGANDSLDTHRGQTLVEFALILPILMIVLFGIVQFGLVFWAQITLTQVGRDAGRWAATQTYSPCTGGASAIQSQATAIAGNSSLYGFPGYPVTASSSWTQASGSATCPPADNQTVWYVNVTLTHDVPMLLPFLADTCTPACKKTLSTSVQYRMEPQP